MFSGHPASSIEGRFLLTAVELSPSSVRTLAGSPALPPLTEQMLPSDSTKMSRAQPCILQGRAVLTHAGDPKEYSEKLPELKKEFNKVNIQKICYFQGQPQIIGKRN